MKTWLSVILAPCLKRPDRLQSCLNKVAELSGVDFMALAGSLLQKGKLNPVVDARLFLLIACNSWLFGVY